MLIPAYGKAYTSEEKAEAYFLIIKNQFRNNILFFV